MYGEIVYGVKRQKLLLLVGAGAMTGDSGDLVDLEVDRPGTIRYDMVLPLTIREVDPAP